MGRISGLKLRLVPKEGHILVNYSGEHSIDAILRQVGSDDIKVNKVITPSNPDRFADAIINFKAADEKAVKLLKSRLDRAVISNTNVKSVELFVIRRVGSIFSATSGYDCN